MKAAIEYLKLEIVFLGDAGKNEKLVQSLRQALAVLEAAEVLTHDDIKRLYDVVNWYIPEYKPIHGIVCPGKILKNKFKRLLESLPEKEGKE